MTLEEGEYEVCIDSSLTDGSLTYGECFLPGEGPTRCSFRATYATRRSPTTTCRGSAWRRRWRENWRRGGGATRIDFSSCPARSALSRGWPRTRPDHRAIKHGLVLTCVGDPGKFHYKRSRRGTADIDRAMTHVSAASGRGRRVLDFSPYGYDERQFCSPGFNLPVGCLMRSVWGQFPEYHSSADNLSLITPEALAGSLKVCLDHGRDPGT